MISVKHDKPMHLPSLTLGRPKATLVISAHWETPMSALRAVAVLTVGVCHCLQQFLDGRRDFPGQGFHP